MGDGALRKQGTRTNALLEVNHSAKYSDYVDWKYNIFKQLTITPPKRRKNNGLRVAYRFTTRSLSIFTQYYDWFYKDGKKQIPLNLKLNPLTLAVWFMDDGSKSRNAVYLNTQQFSVDEQVVLQKILEETHGIESTLNRDKHYYRIRIRTSSMQKYMDTIRPYVRTCFEYKLTQ